MAQRSLVGSARADAQAEARDGGPDTSSASAWGSERLDVHACLRRLGHEGPVPPTVGTLRELHRAHIAAIPFENLDIVTGRGIAIDLDSLQAKLVGRARGGYCFEHNLLFAALLERVGFPVTRLAGRVRMGASKPRPRTHMLLRVEAEGADWLADVGFGAEGLLEPLPLTGGAWGRQGSWTYQLRRDVGERGEPDVWVLQSRRRDEWFDLYSFTLDPQRHVDFVMANHFTSTHPDSPFVGRLVAQRHGPDIRQVLLGRCLTVTRGDGSTDRSRLDVSTVPDVLERTFGIVLTAEERVRLPC